MNQIASTHAIQYRPAPPRGSSLSSRTPVLLLITDDTELADQVQQVSAFLDVEMIHLDTGHPSAPAAAFPEPYGHYCWLGRAIAGWLSCYEGDRHS